SGAATSRSSSTRPKGTRRIATRSRSVGRRSSAACRTSRPSPRPLRPPKASRPWATARSRCGRSRSTTATTPEAQDPAAALAGVVQALERPLTYLASDDFRRAGETTLPLDAIAERIARARAAGAAALDPVLGELADIVAALRAREGDAATLLRRAHGLLLRLRPAVAVEGWREYHATERAPDAALAALAAPASAVRAVGPKRSGELARFGLKTVEDVLY